MKVSVSENGHYNFFVSSLDSYMKGNCVHYKTHDTPHINIPTSIYQICNITL